jgi:hypothetical protein
LTSCKWGYRQLVETSKQPAVSYSTAILIIASVATVWGVGFPMTRIVLDGGLSVGADKGRLSAVRLTIYPYQ